MHYIAAKGGSWRIRVGEEDDSSLHPAFSWDSVITWKLDWSAVYGQFRRQKLTGMNIACEMSSCMGAEQQEGGAKPPGCEAKRRSVPPQAWHANVPACLQGTFHFFTPFFDILSVMV